VGPEKPFDFVSPRHVGRGRFGPRGSEGQKKKNAEAPSALAGTAFRGAWTHVNGKDWTGGRRSCRMADGWGALDVAPGRADKQELGVAVLWPKLVINSGGEGALRNRQLGCGFFQPRWSQPDSLGGATLLAG